MMNNDISIYVHIPFCDSKCKYCNFTSGVFCEEVKNAYFDALFKEIRKTKKILLTNKVVSLYIGGGTPSSVDVSYISQLVVLLKQIYTFDLNCEITIECNPCSTTIAKLQAYKNLGINRISFGVQSLNDLTLKIIGRKHSSEQALNAIKLAKQVGFDNLSVDMLLGLPNQTPNSIISDIDKLICMGITHISTYMLIVEQGTALEKMIKSKEITLPSDDQVVSIYDNLYNFLKKKEFLRYEISNYSRNSESIHNKRYWQMRQYIGYGVASHSYYNGYRFEHSTNILEYIKNYTNIASEKIDLGKEYEEYVFLGLRTKGGIDIEFIKNHFKKDIMSEKENEIKMLVENNFININGNKITITENNYGVSNIIILKLL